MLRFSPNKSQRTVEDPDLDARFVAVERMLQQLVALANVPVVAGPSTLAEQVLQVLETDGGGGGGSNVEPGDEDWDLLRWDDGVYVPFRDLLRSLVIAPETDNVPLTLKMISGFTTRLYEIISASNDRLWSIGTTSATEAIPLSAGSAFADYYSFTTSANPGIITHPSRGTRASPSAVQTNDQLAKFGTSPYGIGGYNEDSGVLWLKARQNHSATVAGVYLQAVLCPNGSVVAQEALYVDTDKLTVPGLALAEGGMGAPITAASAVGALIGVKEAFDETGVSMGWVPVHATFTP